MSDIAYSQFTDLGLAMTPVDVLKNDDPLSVMRRPPMEAETEVAQSLHADISAPAVCGANNQNNTKSLRMISLFDTVLKSNLSSSFHHAPVAASAHASPSKRASSPRSTTRQPQGTRQLHYAKLADLVHFHAGAARNMESEANIRAQTPSGHVHTSASGHTRNRKTTVRVTTDLGFIESAVARVKNDPLSAMRRAGIKDGDSTIPPTSNSTLVYVKFAERSMDKLAGDDRRLFEVPLTTAESDSDDTSSLDDSEPDDQTSHESQLKFDHDVRQWPLGALVDLRPEDLKPQSSFLNDAERLKLRLRRSVSPAAFRALFMASSTTPIVLNPGTPLSYLSPADAASYAVSADIFFFTVGALTWDWLMSMPDEWRVLFIGGISTSKIAYFCSRVFALAYCICSCIITVAPVKNCQALVVANAILIVLALNANNILFFVRVRAVWGKSARITTFFGFCYLAVFSTSMLIPFALNASHILPTNYCMVDPAKIWVAAPMLCNAANDALVFFAISYRITLQSMDGGGRCSKFRRFFRGDGAGQVAKELLYNGQLCYFATMAINIVQIVLALYVPEYETVLSASVIALENAMTCRVHRAVILGLIKDSEKAPVLTTVVTSGSTLMDYELDVKSRLEQREGQIGPIT
ncbi:hypothetical protein HWV62_43224 [Athelia sp. TMB]|nr:hypothetical protein HWV62_43224 [Athelia sp. TMB]